MQYKHTLLWPALSFSVFCLIGLGAREAIGTVYGAAEARDLLEALSRAGLYLGSAIATASATTLALMLTLIGMIRRIETDFDRKTYKQVTRIAVISTVTLMLSFLVLLAFTLPIGEFESAERLVQLPLHRAVCADRGDGGPRRGKRDHRVHDDPLDRVAHHAGGGRLAGGTPSVAFGTILCAVAARGQEVP